MTIRTGSGLEFLELVSRLLQRNRLANPLAGEWEPADQQWWWRSPRSSDDVPKPVWFNDEGEPIAAVSITAWRQSIGLDPLWVIGEADDLLPEVWQRAIELVDGHDTVEMIVTDGDERLIGMASADGFVLDEDLGGTAWMDAGNHPPVTELADGYALGDRTSADGPHHMIPRGGPGIEDRLQETSLYRPDLDLFVTAPDGSIAAYGMFWLDPVTWVGMVEPMRTEQGHEGRGLARHVLTSGLSRLAASGAKRLKVNYSKGNDRAVALYLKSGFEETSTSSTMVRSS